MSEKDNTESLFAAPQSMGAFGSLPIPPLGAEVGEFESHDIVGDDLPEEEKTD